MYLSLFFEKKHLRKIVSLHFTRKEESRVSLQINVEKMKSRYPLSLTKATHPRVIDSDET